MFYRSFIVSSWEILLSALLLVELHAQTVEAQSLNGAQPRGLRITLGATAYAFGNEVFGSDFDDPFLTPTLNLIYFTSKGLAVELSYSRITKKGFVNYSGHKASVGMGYNLPKTILVFKGGIAGYVTELSNHTDTHLEAAFGPYLRLGTLVRLSGNFGVSADLTAYYWAETANADFHFTPSLSIGIAFMPKSR